MIYLLRSNSDPILLVLHSRYSRFCFATCKNANFEGTSYPTTQLSLSILSHTALSLNVHPLPEEKNNCIPQRGSSTRHLLACPPPSNSHHLDFYVFCHYSWEGGQPKTSRYSRFSHFKSPTSFFSKKQKLLSFQETPILNFPIRCHRVATWIFSQQCPHHWIPTSSDECQKWLTGTRQYATFVKPVAFELKTSRQRKKSRAVTATVKYHANCDTYLGANFESSREDQTTCRLVDPWLYECVANFGTLIHLILQPPEKNKNTKVHWNQSKSGEGK